MVTCLAPPLPVDVAPSYEGYVSRDTPRKCVVWWVVVSAIPTRKLQTKDSRTPLWVGRTDDTGGPAAEYLICQKGLGHVCCRRVPGEEDPPEGTIREDVK